MNVLEFSRGCVRVEVRGREVSVLGEMVLDPLGFVVFDQLPFRWSDGESLGDDERAELLALLREVFQAKNRALWLASQLPG